MARKRFSDAFVSLSHEIAPGIGEYARMSTTAANAALGPIMSPYLRRLDQALQAKGMTVPVQVMTGAGGVVPAEDLSQEPIAAMMSGPAAGVIACQQLGPQLDIERLLTIDVGGARASMSVSSSTGSRSCATRSPSSARTSTARRSTWARSARAAAASPASSTGVSDGRAAKRRLHARPGLLRARRNARHRN